MQDKSFKRVAILAGISALFLLCVAAPVQAQIQWAGNAVVDLDANDLAVGNVSSWPNAALSGGSFDVWTVPVEANNVNGPFTELPVTTSNPGTSGVEIRQVNFPSPNWYQDLAPMVWSLGAPADITGGSSFSVEIWHKSEVKDGVAGIFGVGIHSEPRNCAAAGWAAYRGGCPPTLYPSNAQDTLQLMAHNGDVYIQTGKDVQTGAGVAQGKWVHQTLVYDSAAGEIRTYINGQADIVSATTVNIDANSRVAIGAGQFNYYPYDDGFFNGYLGGVSKVRVHSDALTPTQVEDNYLEEVLDYVFLEAPEFAETSVAFTDYVDATFSYTPAMTVNGEPAPEFTLVGAPAGMTINAVNGAITWDPVGAEGDYNFSIHAENSEGSDDLAVALSVETIAPEFGNVPAEFKLPAGETFSYTLPLVQRGAPAGVITLTQAPAGMVVDSNSAEISIASIPGGTHAVEAQIANSIGSDTVSFVLNGVSRTFEVAGDLLIHFDGDFVSDDNFELVSDAPNYGTLGGNFSVSWGPTANAAVQPFMSGTGLHKTVEFVGGGGLYLADELGDRIGSPLSITNTAEDFTIEAWVKNPVVGIDEGVTCFAALNPLATALADSAEFYYSSNRAFWTRGSGPNNLSFDYVTEPPADQWHHIVWVYDGTDLRVVVDGVVDSTTTIALEIDDADDSEDGISMGSVFHRGGSTMNFDGQIHRLRYHSEDLSLAQIQANYDAEKVDYEDLEAIPFASLRFSEPLEDLVVFGAQDPGAGPTAPIDVTVANNGNVAMPAGWSVALGGTDSGEFVLSGVNTSEIPYNGSRTFSVAFDPSDTARKSATIDVSWPAGSTYPAGSMSIPLYGNGSVVYVDGTNGDNGNLGTQASPWATLVYAFANTENGDTIMVEPGTYDEYPGSPGPFQGKIRSLISTGGSDVTTLVTGDWWAFGGGTPTYTYIEGFAFVPKAGGSGIAFQKPNNQDNAALILKDCTFTGTWGYGHVVYLIRTGGGPTRFVAENCTFDLTDTGVVNGFGTVTPGDGGHEVVMTNCDVTMNTRNAVQQLKSNGSSLTVTGSTFTGGQRQIDMYGGHSISDFIIRDSTFTDWTFRPVSFDNVSQVDGAEWLIEDCQFLAGSASDNPPLILNADESKTAEITVDSCYINNLTTSAIRFRQFGTATLQNTIIESQGSGAGPLIDTANLTDNMVYYNNTLIGLSGITGGTGLGAGTVSTIAKNNVVLGGYSPELAAAITGEASFLNADAAGNDPKFLGIDPWAVPSTAQGPLAYAIANDSPLRNAGVTVPLTDDYLGESRPGETGYDIGAHETAPAPQAPSINDSSLANQTVAFGAEFVGPAPIMLSNFPKATFTLDAVSLALGMTINADTGVVSWAMADQEGTFTVTITATNSEGSDDASYDVTVRPQPTGVEDWEMME